MVMDYIINPIKMGGLVKEVFHDKIKVHLHGRLGVIEVPKKLIRYEGQLEPGHEMEFYFSYIEVMEQPYDYDSYDMTNGKEMTPCLLGGKLIEVNDTAGKVAIMENLGTIAVPRRWFFTSKPLLEGENVQFYLSCMDVIGKRNIPKESI